VANLKRKEKDAGLMASSLADETRSSVMKEVIGSARETNLHNNFYPVAVPSFLQRCAA
jgi:hypothetical protein